MSTDAEKVAAIAQIIAGTDEHRNRAKREAWAAIKQVMSGEVVEIKVADPEPESEDAEVDSDGGGDTEVEEAGAEPEKTEPKVKPARRGRPARS